MMRQRVTASTPLESVFGPSQAYLLYILFYSLTKYSLIILPLFNHITLHFHVLHRSSNTVPLFHNFCFAVSLIQNPFITVRLLYTEHDNKQCLILVYMLVHYLKA